MSDADRAVAMMLHDNAALIDKCERLQAENAKLVMKLNAEHLVRQNVERENAKLRELVQSYHSAMLCMLETGIWPTDPEWLEHRMCELGVEVDA